MALTITKNIRLDTSIPGSQGSLVARKGDVGVFSVRITLVDRGTIIVIPDECTAVLHGLKPDTFELLRDADILDGRVIASFGIQAFTSVGIVPFEIIVYGDAGEVLYSPQFEVSVEDVVPNGDIESTDDFTALQTLYAEIVAGGTTHVWTIELPVANGTKVVHNDVIYLWTLQTLGTGIEPPATGWVSISNNGIDGAGVASVVKTNTVGLVDTYTITFLDERTATFDVTNGEKGDPGEGAPSDANPLMDGTAAPGTSELFSRDDHVHPSNTSKANLTVVDLAYNPDVTYALGAYCTNENALYECTTPIAAPESWTIGHWTVRTVGYVLKTLNAEKASKASAPTVNHISTLDENGNPKDSGHLLLDYVPYSSAGIDYADPTMVSMLVSGGVFSGGAVTAQGTPDQTVAIVAVSYITPTGKRYALGAVASLAASAADATNPRIDIVYGSDAGVITYLAGTAAASPAQPATPTNGTLLASITRAANDNTIAAGDITKKRRLVPKASDAEDITSVPDSTNTFTFDLNFKKTNCFSATIANTTGKTFVLSNVPYGDCDVYIQVKSTATAVVTHTLDGRTVSWDQGITPTFTTGYTYEIVYTYSLLMGKWMGCIGRVVAN